MIKKSIAATMFAAAIGASVMLATPAQAETITGNLCDPVDYQAPIGTTVNFGLSSQCDLDSYEVFFGTPSVSVTPVGGGKLVWHQAVEKAAAACEAGWGESWQQWAKDGKGGAVCVKDVEWGSAPEVAGSVSVTLNTEDDYVRLTSSDGTEPDVLGCNASYAGYTGYTLDNTCPVAD